MARRGALKRKTLAGDLSERHASATASSRCSGRHRRLPHAGLLQTIPGIDEVAAALILIEIGDDMARFGRVTSATSCRVRQA
jgi:transposase